MIFCLWRARGPRGLWRELHIYIHTNTNSRTSQEVLFAIQVRGEGVLERMGCVPIHNGETSERAFWKVLDGWMKGRTMWTTMIPTKDDGDDDDYCTFSSDWFGRSVGHEEMLSKGWAV